MKSFGCVAEELLSGVNCDDISSGQVWKCPPLRLLLPVPSGAVLCPALGTHHPFEASASLMTMSLYKIVQRAQCFDAVCET